MSRVTGSGRPTLGPTPRGPPSPGPSEDRPPSTRVTTSPGPLLHDTSSGPHSGPMRRRPRVYLVPRVTDRPRGSPGPRPGLGPCSGRTGGPLPIPPLCRPYSPVPSPTLVCTNRSLGRTDPLGRGYLRVLRVERGWRRTSGVRTYWVGRGTG